MGCYIVYRRSTMKGKSKAKFTHGDFAAVCKALAHPSRVLIVEHLKRVDKCICGKIVDILPLAQSTVSQHLKILKEAGLIRGEIDGPRRCYCLNKDRLEAFRKYASKI